MKPNATTLRPVANADEVQSQDRTLTTCMDDNWESIKDCVDGLNFLWDAKFPHQKLIQYHLLFEEDGEATKKFSIQTTMKGIASLKSRLAAMSVSADEKVWSISADKVKFEKPFELEKNKVKKLGADKRQLESENKNLIQSKAKIKEEKNK